MEGSDASRNAELAVRVAEAAAAVNTASARRAERLPDSGRHNTARVKGFPRYRKGPRGAERSVAVGGVEDDITAVAVAVARSPGPGL